MLGSKSVDPDPIFHFFETEPKRFAHQIGSDRIESDRWIGTLHFLHLSMLLFSIIILSFSLINTYFSHFLAFFQNFQDILSQRIAIEIKIEY